MIGMVYAGVHDLDNLDLPGVQVSSFSFQDTKIHPGKNIDYEIIEHVLFR